MINIWENKQQKDISTNEELNNKINDLQTEITRKKKLYELYELLEQIQAQSIRSDIIFEYP